MKKMKVYSVVMLILIVVATFVIVGCKEKNGDAEKFNKGEDVVQGDTNTREEGTERSSGMPENRDMQESIDVCVSKSDGDFCTVSAPFGIINGTCIYDNSTLICRPEHQERMMPSG